MPMKPSKTRKRSPEKELKTKKLIKTEEEAHLIVRAPAFLVRRKGQTLFLGILDGKPGKIGKPGKPGKNAIPNVIAYIAYYTPKKKRPTRDPNPQAIIGSDLETEFDAFVEGTSAPEDKRTKCATQLNETGPEVFTCINNGCAGRCAIKNFGSHYFCDCVTRPAPNTYPDS